jgi:hypothetical protein
MRNLTLFAWGLLLLVSCKSKESVTPVVRQFPGTDEIIRLSQESESPFSSEGFYADDFEILNAKQEGQWLVFETSYSGGCESHFFHANWDGRMMKSLPPQTNVVVAHQHKQDPCRERVVKKWAIDVHPFFERGENEVVLNLIANDQNTIRIKLVAVE